MRVVLLVLTLTFFANAECVDERRVFGLSLKNLSQSFDVYIENDNQFSKYSGQKIINTALYTVHLQPKSHSHNKNNGDFSRYNRKNIEYYTYPRMIKYIENKRSAIVNIDYQIKVVGKSLGGRNLYYIGPKNLDPNKKTIVMFGRHHGDEQTANWIIEGFLDRYLETNMSDDFQLVLYPMINPDGAMKQTRYNLNRRDLNRAWTNNGGKDEIVAIHSHLKPQLKKLKDIVIALDMHGSWEKDFFYRVERSHSGSDFYEMQSRFIDELALYDSWQAGQIIHSNGHPGMARIVLIKHYGLNALTHETIKNIPLRNSRSRTKETLMEQGEAIVSSIRAIY